MSEPNEGVIMETARMQDWSQVFDFRFLFVTMSSLLIWLADNVDLFFTVCLGLIAVVYGIYGIIERHTRIKHSKEEHQKNMEE